MENLHKQTENLNLLNIYRKIQGSRKREDFFEALSKEEQLALENLLNEAEINELRKIKANIKYWDEYLANRPFTGCTICGNCTVKINDTYDKVVRSCSHGIEPDTTHKHCPIDKFKPKKLKIIN